MSRFPSLFIALAMAVIACLSLQGQVAPTTTLSGVVADATGGVIPNASVELVNTATQFTRRSQTDAQGRFLFTLVPPGSYDLTATAQGFATYKQSGITLDVNVPASLKVTLSISAAAQQVTVQENAPMVDTESGALRQVVSEKYIKELPLNGRNAASLVYMAPGTVGGKGTDTANYASTSDTIAVSVNGTWGDQGA